MEKLEKIAWDLGDKLPEHIEKNLDEIYYFILSSLGKLQNNSEPFSFAIDVNFNLILQKLLY